MLAKAQDIIAAALSGERSDPSRNITVGIAGEAGPTDEALAVRGIAAAGYTADAG